MGCTVGMRSRIGRFHGAGSGPAADRRCRCQHGKELTIDTPSVEGILVTDGSRFTGFASPLTAAPCFSIRRRASAVFPFSQYVADGKMTERQRAILEDAVARRLNTIIVGSTGAGKSTLLNAFIRSMTEITPYHRFVILEDTAELQCAAPDQTIMQTTSRLGIRELLRLGLRSFPDRILIGETRDGSMLDILQAWNTGHPGGATTLHSDTATPVQALERVEDLVMQAVPNPMHRMIARTINLIVCMQIERGVRRVSQIASVQGHDGHNYLIEQEA